MWQSPEQLANPDEFREIARHQELPFKTSGEAPAIDRREFGRVMAAILAMGGATACTRQPPEHIVPYVNQPSAITQGVPLYFATAMPFAGDALGLLVKSHMGHPIKVEGNPRHPASLGSTDAFAQASVLGLYDPDRSQTVISQGRISTWLAFIAAISGEIGGQSRSKMRLLTESVISPTLARQIQLLLQRYPEARWHQWEAVNRDGIRLGSRMAFGQFVNTCYRFERADVVLAVDADFLFCGAGNVRYARDFSSRRGSRAGASMNRLYVVESTPTSTGASADHRKPLRPSELELFLRAVAQGVGAPGGAAVRGEHAQWVNAIVKDLQQHRGASLVVVGEHQAASMHAIAHGINAALGNAGNTVVYTDPVEANPVEQMASLRELVDDMNNSRVDTVIILGGNPVYDAPADLGFAGALGKVKRKVRLGLYEDETSAYCDWHIPQSHFLEDWSDCLAFDGTASIIQPLIAPLYFGRSAHEVLSVLLGEPGASPYEIVRAYWRTRAQGDFEKFWRQSLHDGVVAGTALPPKEVAVTAGLAERLAPAPAAGSGGLEVQFRPDPTVWDGRFANNGYLQELPKPISKLTWDAVALVSPNTARGIASHNGVVVELEFQGRKIEMPVWVEPGQADGCVTVALGYGRTRAGRTGNTGFNAYPLRTSNALWAGAGLRMRPAGRSYRLACTQDHFTMDGRYPVRMASLDAFKADPDVMHKDPFEEAPPPGLTLYPKWSYEGYKWGMSIDLNACMGCNACVVACETENNIAIVGKEQVFRGRIMHWLRIDRYFHGPQEDPRLYLQPTPCMQCENAPCELVCPVNATTHSSEGINQMVYNRCVGTRYCSNNCPYKVRRFNFFLFSNWYEQSLTLMRNPDVSVRSRGVMEKCTYCIQRIEHAKITAEREDRSVRDGEIRTACQQACPTQAIVFGNLNDPKSRLVQLKKERLDYGLLAELNTRPRTTYLGRIVNLNPELKTELS